MPRRRNCAVSTFAGGAGERSITAAPRARATASIGPIGAPGDHTITTSAVGLPAGPGTAMAVTGRASKAASTKNTLNNAMFGRFGVGVNHRLLSL